MTDNRISINENDLGKVVGGKIEVDSWSGEVKWNNSYYSFNKEDYHLLTTEIKKHKALKLTEEYIIKYLLTRGIIWEGRNLPH